jgi:hypothetical protein
MIQRNKEFFDKFLYDCVEGETDDVVEFNIGYVPYSIERISDGEILYFNEDNKTYSFKKIEGYGDSPQYSWARLFLDPRAKGYFKVLGWAKIENLESIHKALKK